MNSRPPRRAALALAALTAALLAMTLAVPRAQAARKVYFPSRCTNAAFEPHSIVVTCADGKTTFETSNWLRWGTTSAHTTGVLIHPECGSKPLVACSHYVEDEATITLSGPVKCAGRWKFTRMLLEDLEAPTPSTRQFRESFPC